MTTTSDLDASGATPADPVEIPDELQALNRRLAHLEAIAREYAVTIRVLGVVAERLLEATGGDTVVISDEALAGSPSLDAGREVGLGQVWIRVLK